MVWFQILVVVSAVLMALTWWHLTRSYVAEQMMGILFLCGLAGLIVGAGAWIF